MTFLAAFSSFHVRAFLGRDLALAADVFRGVGELLPPVSTGVEK